MFFSVLGYLLTVFLTQTHAGKQRVQNVQVGSSVNFTCSKAAESNILWDRERHWEGGSIGIRGVVQRGHQDKYYLQHRVTSNKRIETLTIVNVTMDDDDTFRCSTLYQQDYVTFKLNILGNYPVKGTHTVYFSISF